LKSYRALLVVLSALALVAATSQTSVGADAGVRVIVNPQVRGTQISRATLTQIFLRQAERYADGVRAMPVDQSVKSPVRSTFSNRLLGQALIEVQVYWQRQMSHGVIPPPVRTTDEDVVAFVAQTPGAIGYVSSAVALPETVRAIEVAD
jgi:ABC-type phosphate transport system substrate-binding protein